jgi:hypothetical protein
MILNILPPFLDIPKIDLFVFVDKNLGNMTQPRDPLFFRIEDNFGLMACFFSLKI